MDKSKCMRCINHDKDFDMCLVDSCNYPYTDTDKDSITDTVRVIDIKKFMDR